MPGTMEGYLLGYACRRQPTLQGPLQHLVLEALKDKSFMPFPEQSVGFITDGVVYNLLRLLHTGGHEHLAVGIRLYLLPGKLPDVALPQSRQAGEKESSFQNLFLAWRFGKPYQFLLAQMLSHGGNTLDTVQKAVGILLYLPVTVGRVQDGTESRPVARRRIDMQLLVGMYGLGSVQQVLHELAAQVHVHLFKGAFAIYKPFKVFVDVLPLDIPSVCQFLEVGEEIPFHPGLVKEAVVLVEDGFVTPVAEYLCLLHHACVEVTLLLVGRFGKNVNTQSFTCYHFHGGVVTVAGIIVQTQRILCTVLNLALAQGNCLAFAHNDVVLTGCTFSEVSPCLR